MKKLKIEISNILVLIFFIHGVMYFFTPATSYVSSNPIKFVKYIIVTIIIALVLINKHNFRDRKKLRQLGISCLILIGISFIYLFANKGENIGLLLTYMSPIMVVFIIDDLTNYINFRRISVITYILASIVAYINTYLLKGIFSRWHVEGAYREVSIFINPNNFAIMIAILTIFFISTYKELKHSKKNIVVHFLMVINSFFLIRMSGSNTGLVVFILTIIYCLVFLCKSINFTKKNKKRCVIVGTIIIISLVVIVVGVVMILNKSGNIRQISLQSTFIRLENYLEFINTNVNSLIFPYRNNYVYVDNIYLSIWGSFGLPIMICFIAYNIYLLKITIRCKKTNEMFIVIVFMLIGITTNFLYLWPIGYLYWGITTLIVNKCSYKKAFIYK